MKVNWYWLLNDFTDSSTDFSILPLAWIVWMDYAFET